MKSDLVFTLFQITVSNSEVTASFDTAIEMLQKRTREEPDDDTDSMDYDEEINECEECGFLVNNPEEHQYCEGRGEVTAVRFRSQNVSSDIEDTHCRVNTQINIESHGYQKVKIITVWSFCGCVWGV